MEEIGRGGDSKTLEMLKLFIQPTSPHTMQVLIGIEINKAQKNVKGSLD